MYQSVNVDVQPETADRSSSLLRGFLVVFEDVLACADPIPSQMMMGVIVCKFTLHKERNLK